MRFWLANGKSVIQNIDMLHAENYSLTRKVQEVHLRTTQQTLLILLQPGLVPGFFMAGIMNRQLLLEQLQRHEGLRLKPYRDTEGKLTVGYGRNLDDCGISEDEAGFMLDNDIDEVVADLERMPLYLRLDPIRKVVLANMCFNLGLTRFLEFRRMLAALADEDWERAAAEMMDSKWARQVGSRAVELSELMRRGEAPQ